MIAGAAGRTSHAASADQMARCNGTNPMRSTSAKARSSKYTSRRGGGPSRPITTVRPSRRTAERSNSRNVGRSFKSPRIISSAPAASCAMAARVSCSISGTSSPPKSHTAKMRGVASRAACRTAAAPSRAKRRRSQVSITTNRSDSGASRFSKIIPVRVSCAPVSLRNAN